MSAEKSQEDTCNTLMDEYNAALLRQEDLHPDLEPYAYEERVGDFAMEVVKHPLCYSVPHHEARNALVNLRYRMMREQAREARESENWSKYIMLHERPYRINAFFDVMMDMNDEEYWRELGFIYTDTENMHENLPLWVHLLSSTRLGREYLMNEADRAALAELPKELTIYRGCDREDEQGIAWTLDKDKAKWFAQRFGRKPLLKSGTVLKPYVIAHFLGRGESEIVVRPKHITNLKVRPL